MTISVALADESPRARYALDVLLGLVGAEATPVAADGEADLAYGEARGRVRLQAGPQHGWDDKVPEVAHVDGLPLLYLPGGKPGDLVYATYACLLAPWERTDPADEAGCPLAAEGFLMRHRLLRTPLVHEYAARLAELLRVEPVGEPALVLTHDVDNNWAHLFARRESARLLALDARAGQPAAAARRLVGLARRVARPLGADPNDRFDEWSAWHRRRGGRPSYFVASAGLFAGGAARQDVPYDVRHPEVRATLRAAAAAGAEIGVHFSFNARESVERLAAERAALEEVVGRPVRSSRHHWWAVGRPPEPTWAAHAAAGVAVDCSLGFNDAVGFRRGICVPFHPFDPVRERSLELCVLPTVAMDAAALAAGYEAGLEELRVLSQTVLRVRGCLVLDWHVHAANPAAMSGAMKILDAVAAEALEGGFRPRTPLELVA